MSDIAIAVREGADAVMLSGETAYGRFPFKSVAVMSTVAKKTEKAMLSYEVTVSLSCLLSFLSFFLLCSFPVFHKLKIPFFPVSAFYSLRVHHELGVTTSSMLTLVFA